MLPRKTVLKVLGLEEKLTKDEKKRFKKLASVEHVSLEEALISEHAFLEGELYEKAAKLHELPYKSFADTLVNQETLEVLPESFAKSNHVAVVGSTKSGNILIATSSIPDKDLIRSLQEKLKKNVSFVLTDETSMKSILSQYRKDIEEELKKIHLYSDELDVTSVFEAIMEKAIKDRASDVHVEPSITETVIRYRIDGVLRRIATLPKALHSAVIARIKVMAKLRVDEHRLPQDGRYSMVAPDYRVSIRVSIMSLDEGEKAVLRILPEKRHFFTLEELGFLPGPRQAVEKYLLAKQGMGLVVGPTGSGKTTTLYTLISMINVEGINISTIEDPIEYSIPNVNQSQVKPQIGLTFSVGLRAFLRQDPDVLMVGEVRDTETGEIAMRAALTGHLVLSTLHTRDAANSLPRLTQMGIERYLIPPTINFIIAQRLARKVCEDCAQPVKLSDQVQTAFEEVIKMPLDEFLKKHSIKKSDINLRIAAGCPLCNDTGYSGRVGIYEVLENTPEIQSAVLVGSFAKQIHEIAVRQGMVTLTEDGGIKVLTGLTTVDELIRVL